MTKYYFETDSNGTPYNKVMVTSNAVVIQDNWVETTEDSSWGVAGDSRELYQVQRATEYPSIEEQLDMQYWDSVNGTAVWANTIKAIKDKFPKEV
jgi:hypothetical protein